MIGIRQKLRYYAKPVLRAFYLATANRSRGLKSELRFWENWCRTEGLKGPEHYERRLDPDSYLSEYHRNFIDHLPQQEIKILDVGAGPLTVLGKRHPSKEIIIVATDVLAEQYDLLLNKYKIQPPVRTVFGEAEKLTEIFSEESFDFVNARNSIDHIDDPLEAIKQMLYVVKENCFVAMDHVENEGENQHYKGLHQWNLSIKEGHFTIKGRSRVINVSIELASIGEFKCFSENNLVIVQIRKKQGRRMEDRRQSQAYGVR